MTWPTPGQPADLHALLADPVRRQLVGTLTLNDVQLSDLAAAIHLSPVVVAAALELLLLAGLVTARRSDAHAGAMFYHLDLEQLQTLSGAAGIDLPVAVSASAEGESLTAAQKRLSETWGCGGRQAPATPALAGGGHVCGRHRPEKKSLGGTKSLQTTLFRPILTERGRNEP